MRYHHLSTFERGRIEELTSLGLTNRIIAKRLGRHRSTIDRELRRNKTKTGYHSEFAQMSYHLQRKKSKSKGKRSDELIEIIEEKLSATWSPEQIANTVMLSKISNKTIYNWIYMGSLHGMDSQVLRHKGKRRKADNRSKFSMGMPISERPKEVAHRLVFGHWELDTMVSSRGESKGCFGTFVERKSRLYTALLIPDRTATSMLAAISQLYRSLPKGAFKIGTTDRGKEFACYKKVYTELGLQLYFADAYSSWQRGSNENANGLLREFYPKKTDLAKVNQQDLIHNLFLINNRPRKCLGWKSPIQVFLHEVAHLT